MEITIVKKDTACLWGKHTELPAECWTQPFTAEVTVLDASKQPVQTLSVPFAPMKGLSPNKAGEPGKGIKALKETEEGKKYIALSIGTEMIFRIE